MNHLAHLFLSHHSDGMMVGNFIADGIKGKQFEKYPAEIARGIIMHRAIDTFTDTHKVVSESKRLLRPTYGLFSSILIDLFYDYFLARNWQRYTGEPLPLFAARCYDVLGKNVHLMPRHYQVMLPYMQRENWLLNYATIPGIRRSLDGMSRRIKNHPGLENAWQDLQAHEARLEEQFLQFFPKLIDEVVPFTAARNQHL